MDADRKDTNIQIGKRLREARRNMNILNVTTDYLLDNNANCDIEDVNVVIKHTDEQVLIDDADNTMINSTSKETYQKKVNSINWYIVYGVRNF